MDTVFDFFVLLTVNNLLRNVWLKLYPHDSLNRETLKTSKPQTIMDSESLEDLMKNFDVDAFLP
jgi:hypothetical protein